MHDFIYIHTSNYRVNSHILFMQRPLDRLRDCSPPWKSACPRLRTLPWRILYTIPDTSWKVSIHTHMRTHIYERFRITLVILFDMYRAWRHYLNNGGPLHPSRKDLPLSIDHQWPVSSSNYNRHIKTTYKTWFYNNQLLVIYSVKSNQPNRSYVVSTPASSWDIVDDTSGTTTRYT